MIAIPVPSIPVSPIPGPPRGRGDRESVFPDILLMPAWPRGLGVLGFPVRRCSLDFLQKIYVFGDCAFV